MKAVARPSGNRLPNLPPYMQHENLNQSLEDLAARMVKLRDSL